MQINSEPTRKQLMDQVKQQIDEIKQLQRSLALAWENHLLHEQIFVLTEAKIKRLQEALEEIAKEQSAKSAIIAADLFQSIARAALKEGE